MSNPYWKRKIQLKEAHEAGHRSALNEQRPPRNTPGLLRAIEAQRKRLAALQKRLNQATSNRRPQFGPPPVSYNPTLEIRNRLPEVDIGRRVSLRNNGLPDGFIDVVDTARRTQLAELLRQFSDARMADMSPAEFERLLRDHLELFGEFYPESLRDLDAFQAYLLRLLGSADAPGGAGGAGLPPLEGPGIDDILRKGQEGLGG